MKEVMGHANIATTMGYTHLVAARLKTLVKPARLPRSKEAAS
jgi:site-specific recombinase XerD